MDQGPLVERQIDDGRRLVEQLSKDNFDVTAAFWVKESEEGRWLFYIASKLVDEQGLFAAYMAVHNSMRSLQDLDWIGPGELKLIGVENPITKDVLDILSRRKAPGPFRYFGNRLGRVTIDEAYIYVPDPSTVLTQGKS